MNSDDLDDTQSARKNPSDESSTISRPEVFETTNADISTGQNGDTREELQPEQTVVAETNRATPHALESRPSNDRSVELRREKLAEDVSEDRRRQHHAGSLPEKGPSKPASTGRSSWMHYAMMGVVALVCGAAGAWGFSYFHNTKDKMESQANGAGQGSSTEEDASKSKPSGVVRAGDAEGNGHVSGGEADHLKKQIEYLSSRFDAFQKRMDSMAVPRDANPPDLDNLRVKVGELSRSLAEVVHNPAASLQMEKKLDQLHEEVGHLRDQLSTRLGPDGRGVVQPAKVSPR